MTVLAQDIDKDKKYRVKSITQKVGNDKEDHNIAELIIWLKQRKMTEGQKAAEQKERVKKYKNEQEKRRKERNQENIRF